MTDLQLIAAYQSGDQSAFSHLYRRYKDRVLWFIYRYVGNLWDAEDITQDTFVCLIKYRDQYRQDSNAKFSTWLYEIAKNQVRNFFIRQQADKRSARVVSIQAEQEQEQHRPLQLVDPGFSPEQLADHSIGMQIYQKKLKKMNPDFADAYRLYAQDFSYKEISQILNIPVNTVRSRIYRAREQLL